MNLGVFPSIANIRFIQIIDDYPAINDNSKSLRWFIVMFMDFGWTGRKIKIGMIYRMVERKFQIGRASCRERV